MSDPDRSAEYAYNDLGRLATATVTTGTATITESYLYDWAGTRTAKITDGVLTYYLVDTGGVLSQVLAELDHTGALITYYTRGAELISLSRPGEKRFYLYDGQGSTHVLADTDGQVTDTYLYDAFGNLLFRTGTTENDFLYTGEQFDANTGFYYLRARYMNPSTGTFTSMDPYAGTIFDPVSLHKYLYANANPVMNRDPSGEFTLLEMELTMAISGEISGALNLLYYDFHGGDRSATSTRIGILFMGFFQGALMTGGLVGLGLIGTVASRIVLSFILMCLGINSMAGAIDRFQAGDDVWGWIFTGASILCFFGAVDSITQAIRIYGINNDNTSLANANATKGGGVANDATGGTPKVYTNGKGQLTNGQYTLDANGMKAHLTGSTTSGKSQFLYGVDAGKATLDAASYADANNLWVGNKAKVPVIDGVIGVEEMESQRVLLMCTEQKQASFILVQEIQHHEEQEDEKFNR